MAKFNRKPLEKTNIIPHFKVWALLPIIAFFLLLIWFWNNTQIVYWLIIGLAVVEMALVLTDGLLRKERGGRFDRGDIFLVGAGAIAIVYVAYLLITM